MMYNFTVVDRVVLGSIAGGFSGNMFYWIIRESFFQVQLVKVARKRLLLDAILTSIAIGLFWGIMTFTFISFNLENIEEYNFVKVFFIAFLISLSSIIGDVLEPVFRKLFASSSND